MMFAFLPVGLLLLLRKLRPFAKPGGNTIRFSDWRGKAASRFRSRGYGASHNAAAQRADYPKRAAPDSRWTDSFNHDTPNKKKERTALEKKTGKGSAVLLVLATILLFFIGASAISAAVQGFLYITSSRWTYLVLGALFLAGASITFFTRNFKVRRFTRYKNYYAYSVGHGILTIQDLARAAGVSVRAARRDILAMISDGYFGKGVYFDYELDSLVFSPEEAKAARQAAYAGSVAKPPPPPPAEAKSNPYMAIILELRELNSSIADIPISIKIDRIEEVTAKIFRIVEDHPEKQPQIRRFMNYYLPTTLKLLRSYATLEKQGIRGENITSAKENIGRILDTLATGFEQQLDQLFRSEAIDIAADINVLENLMQQDGLTRDKPEMKVMESSTW